MKLSFLLSDLTPDEQTRLLAMFPAAGVIPQGPQPPLAPPAPPAAPSAPTGVLPPPPPPGANAAPPPPPAPAPAPPAAPAASPSNGAAVDAEYIASMRAYGEACGGPAAVKKALETYQLPTQLTAMTPDQKTTAIAVFKSLQKF